jgi:hypothetical protein
MVNTKENLSIKLNTMKAFSLSNKKLKNYPIIKKSIDDLTTTILHTFIHFLERITYRELGGESIVRGVRAS